MNHSIFSKNASDHIRLLAVKRDNAYACGDLCLRDFDSYLHYHLKKEGFEKIIFFDGARNFGEYYLDEDSATLVRPQMNQKKKKNYIMEEEEEEEEDIPVQQEVRLRYQNITTANFFTTFKAQMLDTTYKTAIVFINVIHFMTDHSETFRDYFDFIQYGFDVDNDNMMIFVGKDTDFKKLAEEGERNANNYFLKLFFDSEGQPRNDIAMEVGSPDSYEIDLFLKHLELVGMKGKRIKVDEMQRERICEMIRLAMFDRYQNNMTISNIYTYFSTFLQDSNQMITPVDETVIRKIFNFKGEIEEDPYDVLMHTKGWEDVANQIQMILDDFEKEREERKIEVQKPTNRFERQTANYQYPCPNFMLIGSPGVGKTTVANLIGQIFRERGILRNGNVVVANSSDCIGEYVGETGPKTNRLINKAKDGILLLDEAYNLYSDPNAESIGDDSDGKRKKDAVDILVSRALENNICIILAGYSKTKKLFEMNEGMKSRFQVMQIDSFEPETLNHIFLEALNKHHYTLSNNIDTLHFFTNLKNFSPKNSFANAREVNNVFDAVKKQMRQRDPTTNTIIREDFVDYERYFMEVGSKESLQKIFQAIDENYIGLENLKDFIESLRGGVLRKKGALNQGGTFKDTGKNIILVGNPGTGKTTIANLLAEFYYEMGILGSKEILFLKAGSTSPVDLEQAIERANDEGRLLFIDEANYYTSRSVDAKRLINPLLNPTENDVDYPDLRVVLAIYPENLRALYQVDSGLQRRFIEFQLKDYSADELYQMIEIALRKERLNLSDQRDDYLLTVADYLKEYLKYLERNHMTQNRNAGLVNIILKGIAESHALRCENQLDDRTITIEDLTSDVLAGARKVLGIPCQE